MSTRAVAIETSDIGHSALIDLPAENQPLGIRKIRRMRDADVIAALRLVEANVARLLEQWRKYHG